MIERIELQPPPPPRHPLSVGLKPRAGVVAGLVSVAVAVVLAVTPARRGERVQRVGTAAALAAVGLLMAVVSRRQVRRHRRAVAVLHDWAATRGWVVDGARVRGSFEGVPMALRVGYDLRGHPKAIVCEVGRPRAGWWALSDERFEEGDHGIATRIDALCAGVRRAS